MKKAAFLFPLLALFALGGGAVHAQTGEIAGELYSTDILALVNGQPMESYSIGGQTAVIAEDLSEQGYGFLHTYDDAQRILYVISDFSYVQQRDVSRGTVGSVTGNFYETDIRVIFNGHEITGYNIGGKTAVAIEDLGTLDGTSENEQYGYSKYLCHFIWDNDTRTVTLNAVQNNAGSVLFGWNHAGQETSIVPSIQYSSQDNVLTASYDPMNYYFPQLNTQTFSKEPYILYPLMFHANDTKTEIGLCFFIQTPDLSHVAMQIDPQKALPTVQSLQQEPLPYAQALEHFQQSARYTIRDRCDLENHTFLLLQDSQPDPFYKEEYPVYFISLSKTGGYRNIGQVSTAYHEITLKKKDAHTVSVSVSPFAGPHGATTMSQEFNLNDYQYEKVTS